MLLRDIKEPLAIRYHTNGGGPCKGGRPAHEGQPDRPKPASHGRHRCTRMPQASIETALVYDATAPSCIRATTPGRGINHDGRTLACGFQDGNILWRSRRGTFMPRLMRDGSVYLMIRPVSCLVRSTIAERAKFAVFVAAGHPLPEMEGLDLESVMQLRSLWLNTLGDSNIDRDELVAAQITLSA